MLTIGSLFSGIGGLELGLEWAGLGPVLWQVESDPFCQRILAKHWPEAERFDDVRAVGAELRRVDLICGGFPCQDLSPAGTREGLAGERSGLWREFARVVSAVRPRWVVVENTGGGASAWVDAVSGDLAERGYEVLPCPVSAWAVGASHIRQRVFLVAYAHDRDGQLAVAEHAEVAEPPSLRADSAQVGLDAGLLREGAGASGHERARAADGRAFSWGFEPDLVRAVHGIPSRVDRVGALGNAVVPQCAEVVGWVVRELAGV